MNAAAILQAIAAQPGIDPAFARVIAADPELVEVHPAAPLDRCRLEYLESVEFPTPHEFEELRELLSLQTDEFIATRGAR